MDARGGLDISKLSEEVAVGVEEDYQVCVRMLAQRWFSYHKIQTESPTSVNTPSAGSRCIFNI